MTKDLTPTSVAADRLETAHREAAPKSGGSIPAEPPPSRRLKIAYVKRGLFSYSNVRIGEQLRRLFPDYDVEELDVLDDVLRKNKTVVVINFFCIVWRYWRELLTRRQTIRSCFYRTPYIFRTVRKLVLARLEPLKAEYAFSFQTQSLYDGSISGLPHFLYTDHTHLTNLAYPGFSRSELFSRDWIDLEQQIYRNATHVFVMGEHVRRTLIELYGCAPQDSSCVYAGSNIDASPAVLNNDGYGNRTVLFVGIDWKRKGGPGLVEAFHLVLERLPTARLVLVGAAPKLSHPQIEVVGRAPRAEVKRRFTEASVFCLPTRVEPLGIAVIEAFLHKIPVVASDIGAMPDLVANGESGLLVPPDDPKALADALVELLTDPEKCRRFGERGHELVGARYSWDETGRKVHARITARLQANAPNVPVRIESATE